MAPKSFYGKCSSYPTHFETESILARSLQAVRAGAEEIQAAHLAETLQYRRRQGE